MTVLTHIKRLTALGTQSISGLKPLINPLWQVLTFNIADDLIAPKESLYISIERGICVVVYGKRALSKISIKGFKRFTVGDGAFPSSEILASSVALAAREFGAADAEVALGIPKEWVLTKVVELPAATKQNLCNAVSYEMDRLTPFRAEEAYFDFRIFKESKDKINLLLIAVRTDTVQPYINALAGQGLTVHNLTLGISNVDLLCNAAAGKDGYIFLETDDIGYQGAVFHNHSLINAFTGVFSLHDDRSKANALLHEIEFQKETAREYGEARWILLSARHTSASFRELMKSKSKMPVKILDETALRLNMPADAGEISFAAISGILARLQPHAKTFNLMSKGVHEIPGTPKLLTVVLLSLCVLLLIGFLISPVWIEGKRLEEIEQQIALRKEEVRKVEALKKEIDVINSEIVAVEQFKRNREMVLDVMKNLSTILPQNAWLSRLRVTGTIVEIEGYAHSATEVLSKLEASNAFKKAEFATQTIKDGRTNTDRFSIRMQTAHQSKLHVKALKDEKK